MKKEKLEKLKVKMEKERDTLEKIMKDFAKKTDSSLGDWETRFPNFKAAGTLDEEADEVEEYTSLLPVERALETKLQNINDALEKINKDNYGKCQACKGVISEERLELIPEAKTCNDCKE